MGVGQGGGEFAAGEGNDDLKQGGTRGGVELRRIFCFSRYLDHLGSYGGPYLERGQLAVMTTKDRFEKSLKHGE